MVDLSRTASLDQARLLDRQNARLEEIFERERRLGLQLAMRTRIAALLIIVLALILGQQGEGAWLLSRERPLLAARSGPT